MKVGDLVKYRGWKTGTSPIMLVVKSERRPEVKGGGEFVTIHSKFPTDAEAKIHTVHSDWIEVLSESR